MSDKPCLRIAVLGTRGIPDVMGGIETHCKYLYPRLAAMGHKVTIFARKGYVPDTAFVFEGVTVEPLWTPRRKNLEAIFHTAYGIVVIAARHKEFDLLHIHAIGPSLLVPLARALGIKTVITHHGPDYDRQKWGFLAKAMLRLGERWGCRYADCVIAVSRHVRKTIKALYSCDGYYVPNGVTLPEVVTPGQAMQKFALVPCRYILAVGRFVPEKGFHDLLEAFRQVDSDWQLVIAGSADHEDAYSKRLREMAASDSRVVLTGFIKGSELAEIYSNAGLFALPSYHEGLPIALLEAMSYGLPIIASDIPANRELTEDAEVFPVGDVNAMKKMIHSVMSDPSAAVSKLERIEREFNWDVVAIQTEQVYLNA